MTTHMERDSKFQHFFFLEHGNVGTVKSGRDLGGSKFQRFQGTSQIRPNSRTRSGKFCGSLLLARCVSLVSFVFCCNPRTVERGLMLMTNILQFFTIQTLFCLVMFNHVQWNWIEFCTVSFFDVQPVQLPKYAR